MRTSSSPSFASVIICACLVSVFSGCGNQQDVTANTTPSVETDYSRLQTVNYDPSAPVSEAEEPALPITTDDDKPDADETEQAPVEYSHGSKPVHSILEFAVLATKHRPEHRPVIAYATSEEFAKSGATEVLMPTEDAEGTRLVAGWRNLAVKNGKRVEFLTREQVRNGELVLRFVPDPEQTNKPVPQFLVIYEPESERVKGRFLTRVSNAQDPSDNNSPAIGFHFNEKGAYRFGNLTSSHLPNREKNFRYHLGILLDGKLESAPIVNSTIKMSGLITGDFTQEEVDSLVERLNAAIDP